MAAFFNWSSVAGSHKKAFYNENNFEEEHNHYKEQIDSLQVETKDLVENNWPLHNEQNIEISKKEALLSTVFSSSVEKYI